MRQIKFRVWDKKGKYMTYEPLIGKILEYTDECVNYKTKKLELGATFFLNEYFKKDKNPIMQFTGLKDKKKNDVYEGDIITFSCPHCGDKEMAAVIWIDELACWGLANYDYPIGFPFQIPADDWESLVVIEVDEVVGNIYENPKLLK